MLESQAEGLALEIKDSYDTEGPLSYNDKLNNVHRKMLKTFSELLSKTPMNFRFRKSNESQDG